MSAELGAVNGVLIWTERDRLPALRAFYVETLGLRPRADRPGHVDFQWGELRLTLVPHEEVRGPSRDPLRVMVNFAVDDIHAVHARLLAAGVAFIRPPEQEPWGGWLATFADPDGNTLQLMQTP